jgi:PBP1b-binding outer membrane lipoprotein LpoB
MKKLLLLAALMFAVSGCATTETAQEPAAQTTAEPTQSAAIQSVETTCPQICRMMPCPPPGGPYKKCCPVAPYNQTCP